MPTKKKAPAATIPQRSLVVSEPLESQNDNPLALPELQTVLDRVDNTIQAAKDEDNPEIAFTLVDGLVKTAALVGPALARALWLLSHNWDSLGKGIEVPFAEFAQHRFGKESDTIRRYLQVGDFHDALTRNKALKAETAESIKSLPMQAQVRMAQHYREHGALPVSALKELANASSTKEVTDKLKTLRGEGEGPNAPRANGIRFVVNTSNNELVAWVGEEMEVMGILRKDTGTESAMRARETMLRRLGAEEK